MTRLTAVLLLVGVLGFARGGAAQYSFEEVVSGLKHADPATRLRAIDILKDAAYAEAAEPIAAVLEDPDDRVQLAALDAERVLFTTAPVARRRRIGLVIEVRDAGSGGQSAALRQLSVVPRRLPPSLLRGLSAVMRDRNPRVGLAAIDLFGALAPLAGREAANDIRSGTLSIVEALRRGDPSFRLAAATAAGSVLRDCGSERTEQPALCAELGNALVESINGRDARVRRAAMQALGDLRYSPAEQALADQLSFYQKGPDARAALEGLARIGSAVSVAVFKRTLTSGDAEMRRIAVEGLARSGQPEHTSELDQLGQTERSAAILLALHFAAVKLRAASPAPLVESLRDPGLRPQALQYLVELSPSMAPALAVSLADADADVRRSVADALGFSRDGSVVAALNTAAKDQDGDVAAAAQRAIDRITLSL